MTFNPQQLQHKITIEARSYVQDATTGELTPIWTMFAEPFAKVEPLVGREYWAAQQTHAADPVKFTIRYRPGLLPSMRITWQSTQYDISSIQNVTGRNRELLIFATAGVNSG